MSRKYPGRLGKGMGFQLPAECRQRVSRRHIGRPG